MLQDDEGKRWVRNGKMERLVSPESATYGRDWERGGDYVISINEDHSTMVKFAENDRDGFPKVCEVIEQFLYHAYGVIVARLRLIVSGELYHVLLSSEMFKLLKIGANLSSR